MFAGIRKLMPGHTLTCAAAAIQQSRSNSSGRSVPGEFERRSDEEWIAECRTRLEDAVRTR